MESQHFYEFGPFRLDPVERVLLRDHRPVPVPPKDIDTLIFLVEHHGHIVEKEEILEKVWAGVFVEEGNLARRVSNLRTLLGDGQDGNAFIETIARRGYRFVGPVKETRPRSPDPIFVPSASTVSPTIAARQILAWVTFGILVAVALGATLAWRRLSSTRAHSFSRAMLVVLPVQNLSGHAERDYVTDGLTEEIISQLGNLNPGKLGVIARTSSMAYKGTAKTVDQIGRELKVDYVLESSLRESGGIYRITAQLIRTSDQTHFWAHDYEGSTGDLLALQKQVGQAVMQQIRSTFGPDEKPARVLATTANRDAYDAYLKGRFFWNKRTPESMNAAIEFFQQAIKLDPAYAAAYAGLADCYDLQVWFEQLKPEDGFLKAKATAQKALDLDDALADAHVSLASVLSDREWDWRGAEKEFRRALALNPNYATAHHWYAELLAAMGRLDEATSEIKKAYETDPLSPVIGTTVGEMFCRIGQCPNAIEQYEKVLVMYPGLPQAQMLLAEAYAQLGNYERSLEEIEKVRRLPSISAGWAEATAGYAAARVGRRQEALQQIAKLEKDTGVEHTDYFLATVYAALGDRDRAFERLEASLRRHDFSLTLIQADYRLDNLRSDPRYKEFLRRMNF